MHTVGPESLKTSLRDEALGSASRAALDALLVVELRSADLCLFVGESGTSKGLLRLAARCAAGKEVGVMRVEKSKAIGGMWEVADEKDEAWECAGVTVLEIGARGVLTGVIVALETTAGTARSG